MSTQSLDLNNLFKTWLDEEIEALENKRSHMYRAYKKAANQVIAFPEPITTPKQAKSIPYVGEKIFLFLCSRLVKYCEQTEIPVPAAFENYVSIDNGKRRLQVDQEKVTKRRKSKWLPKRRSGGWAMLIALWRYKGSGLCKDELITAAAPYCDSSFTSNPAARDFFSAWDAMKTLINRELVSSRGRPKIYELTEAGAEMAQVFLSQEGLEDETAELVKPDISYDNGIRATPDNSQSNIFVSEFVLSPMSQEVDDSHVRPLKANPKENYIAKEDNLILKPNELLMHDIEKKIYGGIKYDIWCPEDYEIVLLMDNREIRSQTERDFFQTRIVSNEVKCDVRSLSVGDVLWIARHKTTGLEVVLNYVCERKRLDDLAMSIRDGRFTEQKSRLKNSGLKNIYYLVEEGGLGDLQRIADMKQAIETSISMVITNSKFHLKRFRRTDDTIEWLQTMTKLLKRRYEGLRLIVLKPECVNTRDEYLNMLLIFRSKFENSKCSYECVHKYSLYQASMTKTTMMTVKEMFILMLMLIRGMSLEKAVVLQNYFRVPRNLIEFFLENGSGKTEHEKGVLIMDLFLEELGNRKYNKPLLIAVYETWGRE